MKLTYIRVSLGASIKFCNLGNIKSINKCSPYLWSQPWKVKVRYKFILDYLCILEQKITRHYIDVAHHYIYHSQTSIEHYVCSPPDILKYSADIDISRQCTGTPVMASKNMSLYFNPDEVFISLFINVVLVFIKYISTVALYFTQSFQ